jgi:hypothetical protein
MARLLLTPSSDRREALVRMRKPSTRRIELVLEPSTAPDFTRAFDVVRRQGGATLAVGRHGRTADGRPVCYLEVGSVDPRVVAANLAEAGYTVVGVGT